VETCLRRGRLVYGGVDSSMVGEACVKRGGLCTDGRLVYKGARLVYRGIDSSTEGGGSSHIQRGRLVYGGGDSSTERETRLGTETCTFFTSTLVRQTCFAFNFFLVHIFTTFPTDSKSA
jgi:hypothetical protein